MSPSWRDRLLVALAPERVAAVLIRRGLRPVVAAECARDCPVAGGPAWSGALAGLDGLLDELPRGGAARVVVSNRFVRYLDMPWTPGIVADGERHALAADGFRTVHGDAAGAWRLTLDEARFGLPSIAAALDAALIDGLRTTLAKRRWRLVSLRPHLAAALDCNLPALAPDDGGFAVVEPGCVTALFRRGNAWGPVTNRRVRHEAPEEAMRALGQCLDADALQGGEGGVALVAPGLPALDGGRRPVRRLDREGVDDPWRAMAWSAA